MLAWALASMRGEGEQGALAGDRGDRLASLPPPRGFPSTGAQPGTPVSPARQPHGAPGCLLRPPEAPGAYPGHRRGTRPQVPPAVRSSSPQRGWLGNPGPGAPQRSPHGRDAKLVGLAPCCGASRMDKKPLGRGRQAHETSLAPLLKGLFTCGRRARHPGGPLREASILLPGPVQQAWSLSPEFQGPVLPR